MEYGTFLLRRKYCSQEKCNGRTVSIVGRDLMKGVCFMMAVCR